MKIRIPAAPVQRIAFGVAFCSLAAFGAGTIAVATQPASSRAESAETSMTFVEPVADEEPTTTTTEPATPTTVTVAEEGRVAERAEEAAHRAEVAAGRAEEAAVKAETIITSTTTTTAPVETQTMTGRPILTGTTIPVETTTTTTTTVPKTWVVVARIPIKESSATTEPPTLVDVELETGQIRVSNFSDRTIGGGAALAGTLVRDSVLWFADDEASKLQPTRACPATEDNPGQVFAQAKQTTPDCVWRGSWAPGRHTIAAGSLNDKNGWVAAYGRSDTEIIIEEYR